MNEIYILAVVIFACCAWVRYSLKKQIEELDKSKGQAPTPVANAPAAAPYAPAPTPSITINGPVAYNDEIAAVITAAVKAYESETSLTPAALSVSCAPVTESLPAETAPALTVRKYKRRDSLWVATARYESHKRL